MKKKRSKRSHKSHEADYAWFRQRNYTYWDRFLGMHLGVETIKKY